MNKSHMIDIVRIDELREVEPQYALWGEHNVWIVKPGAMSRGRGIQCFDNLAVSFD
jgi:hypothetical protein